MTKEKYYLKEDVFWTLRLAAEVFGGIGVGQDETIEDDSIVPRCAYGMIDSPSVASYLLSVYKKINNQYYLFDNIARGFSDKAVRDVLRKKFPTEDIFHTVRRISFYEWCKELNISHTEFVPNEPNT